MIKVAAKSGPWKVASPVTLTLNSTAKNPWLAEHLNRGVPGGASRYVGELKQGPFDWERGALRYPISDEFQDGTFRRSNFQHGFIRWSPITGAVASVSLEGDVHLNPVKE